MCTRPTIFVNFSYTNEQDKIYINEYLGIAPYVPSHKGLNRWKQKIKQEAVVALYWNVQKKHIWIAYGVGHALQKADKSWADKRANLKIQKS